MTRCRRQVTLRSPLPLHPAKRRPVTDSTPSENPGQAADSWPATLEELRARHPGQKDSVLFCVHKLQQDSAVGLPDLRDEAAERGIPMAGRALHSAKVLLGMAEAKPRGASRTRDASRTRNKRPSQSEASPSPRTAAVGIEDQVLSAVRQIQSAAGAEADRMRQAIRDAIAILQAALDE